MPRLSNSGELLALYALMTRIRAFEERVAERFRAGDVHGFVHVSIGQEAVAAGACVTLEPGDLITTTHRGHGHCLAKGADPEAMMAELFGRATGLCGGKGGSMHLADPRLGILGANGVVGAGIPLAAGAALAAQVLQSGRLAVAFFGEGALHTGAFHEATTLAVAWQLPLILLCERNGYAEFTPTAAWGGPEPADRARSYGVASEVVDGSDALAVSEAVATAAARARTGEGPGFIEAQTTRLGGHYEGDAQPYRDPRELEVWRERDPLLRARAQLDGAEADGADAAPRGTPTSSADASSARAQADAADAAAAEEMDAAVEAALAAPYPEPEAVLADV